MSLFEELVKSALRNQGALNTLENVVEKELLHHDILREMGAAGLLSGLTFIGGTCLRMCYGSGRLSEDLDFTGGAGFNRAELQQLGATLESKLKEKYGLIVVVTPPVKDTGNVDTWRLMMQTRPEQRDLPQQRIHIDICAIPSYQARPMMLRNHYGVDMGTGGLIIQAQSREEILADKLIALALRPNRLKNRDLWDIGWLRQQGVELPLELLPLKLKDRHYAIREFLTLLHQRHMSLASDSVRKGFVHEIRRFLPESLVVETVERPEYWAYLMSVIDEYCQDARDFLLAEDERSGLNL